MYDFDYQFLLVLFIDLICITILIDLYIKNRILTGVSKDSFITWVYHSVALFLVIDVVSVILGHFFNLPEAGRFIFNSLRFLMVSEVAAISSYNTSEMLKLSPLGKRISKWVSIGVVFAIIVLLATNFYNGLLFQISDGVYHRGPFFFVTYLVAICFYLESALVSVVMGIKKKEIFEKRFAFSLAAISIPLIICTLIQALSGFSFLFIGYIVALAFGSLDEEEKNYAAQQKQSNNDDVILGLTQDFAWVAYVTYTARTSYWVAVDFRIGDVIRDNIPDWQEISSFKEKVNLIKDNVVMNEDREKFGHAMTKEAILNGLKSDEAYFFNFRAEINGEIYYYQVKFVANFLKNKLSGFTVGIHSVNEEIKAEMRNKAELEHMVEDRTREISEKNDTLKRMNDDIIELMGNLVEGRDAESGQHIKRVKGFTNKLAQVVMECYPEYELDENKVQLITSASALHDVGKIGIPDAILLKPGRLTDEEFKIMKTHCEKGCEILKSAPRDWDEDYLKVSYEICKYHHEKYDGKGYPCGLKGDEIPISAQIVAIADCYDALVSKRVYKDAYSCDEAYYMIKNGECGAFSDKILDCFAKCKDAFADEVQKIRENANAS